MERDLMTELLAWGSKLPGFDRSHVRPGIRVARCIVDGVEDQDGNFHPGLGALHPDTMHDLALDIAWFFWLDDCFDTNPEQSSNRMLCLSDYESTDADTEAPLEVWSATAVRDGMRSLRNNDPAAMALWMDSIVEMTQAFQRNKRASRGGPDWTFVEYLDNGEQSSAAPHVLATVSLIYGLDLPKRLTDPAFNRMVRHLCLEMRLENDLVSVEKEIEEGDTANVMLIMNRYMPLAAATEFIEEQRMGYETMVLEDLAAMMPDDVFARVIRLVLEACHWFHVVEQDRYSKPNVSAGRR